MRIFLDETSFDEPAWCCVCEGYIYFSATLEGLINLLNTKWKHDDYLAM